MPQYPSPHASWEKISTNVYGLSPFSKGFRKAAAHPVLRSVSRRSLRLPATVKICNQRNDEKTDQHQCSLYKVRYAYSHKSTHKCITEDNSCTNCQSYMVINSKYCVKKFTACCQCRSCINQKKMTITMDESNNRILFLS